MEKVCISFSFFSILFFAISHSQQPQTRIFFRQKSSDCCVMVADSFWQIELIVCVPNAASMSLTMQESAQ